MERRSFLKNSLALTPLLITGIPVQASPSSGDKLLDYLAAKTYGCGKVLVIIQMNGGNDGLNTIIPRDKYAHLANARSNIMIPEASVLPLTGNATTGMHPALAELRDLYNDGKMNIVQGVSYPNPNFSHFRATDIWFSASDGLQYIETGWLGRSLDMQYADYPAAYPNVDMMDPLAVQIGSTLPFSLQGPHINMGYNVTDPAALLNVINATTDAAPANDYGRELSFLRLMKDQSNAYTGRIQNAYNAQATQSTQYPADNALADQLKIVARLIGGGLKTPLYIVNHPNSHDTHSNQVTPGNTTAGYHASTLGILSTAIGAFQDDITKMGRSYDVTGMTYSEFGRRILSNASYGSDHGSSAPVLFFGASLNPTMIGTSPNLPLNANVNDQVPMQYDFRQIYATVMQDWLCLSAADTATVLGSNFTKLPIFTNGLILPTESIELSGQHSQGQSKLSFISSSNENYLYYDVQFSTDSHFFGHVSRLSATSREASEQYHFEHLTRADKMYYRIAGFTLSGHTKYSNTLLLRADDKKQLISVYPNPVVMHQINIKFFETTHEPVDVTIYDFKGAKMYYNRFTHVASIISFSVPPAFARKELYLLEVRYGDTVLREKISFA